MLNRAEFIGNLGADPETRYTPAGVAVSNFRIAATETWKDKNTGEKQERTEWVRLVAFNRLAEIVGEYLKKGSKVYVAGKMQTRKWEDKEGITRYSTEIVVSDMVMLSSKGDGGARERSQAEAAGAEPANQERQQPSRGNSQAGGNTPPIDFDDDIPFMHAWVYPAAGTLVAILGASGFPPGVA